MTRIEQRFQARHAAISAGDDGVFHQQNRVFGRDSHQHDESDEGRHRQALSGQQQAQECTAERQRQRRQNRNWMQHVFEQHDQHNVDAQHARKHGKDEALRQFSERFGIAHFAHHNPRWQRFNARQFTDCFNHVTQRRAGQFDFEIDVARAVVAINHCGATGDL